MESQTLFQKIGGIVAVNTAIGLFYDKLVNDRRVSHFFKNIDMKNQSIKMKAFLAYALGAPIQYSGKNMKDAHAHMPINKEDFDIVLEHLVATLKELNIPNDLIEEIKKLVLTTKKDVVNS